MRQLVGPICGCVLVGCLSGTCRADGGAVRAITRDGSYQISVFTSPTPLVAGPVDISVLVQDAETLAALTGTPVLISLTPRDPNGAGIILEATAEAAGNKLFRACAAELAPGWYDISAQCGSGKEVGRVRFALEVGPPPPRLAGLWPWFTWPAVPVLLFGLHEFLARRRLGKRAGNA
jgi:hypothetical protein